jgi:ketosteroid isomerase-like protein
MKMRAALDVVKHAYEAYGRGDLPALLDLIAEKTDWKFIGPASLPYAGLRTDRKEVADFFAALARADQTDVFEPREFIEAGEHVTVLGWTKVTARDTQKTFDSEWVQVITVQDGKITRWRGFANTAARYGY